MGVALDRPDQADDLHIERDSPVEPWRPVMQGDVFETVKIPNARDHDAVIVMSHPCTMRTGDRLRPILQAAPVAKHRVVELADWPTGFFRSFPLPDLYPNEAKSHAALLDQVGLVRTGDLDLDRRIACLSDKGILLLQQRFVFCLTRAKIRLSTLDAASRPVLEEADLLEQWNESLAKPRCGQGADCATVLAEEATAFDAYLSQPEHEPLRGMLVTPAGRAAVRRAVRQEIIARRTEA